MAKDNRLKRWLREHRKKTPSIPAGVRIVNTPRNAAEGAARVDRVKDLVGTPFVNLPGITDHSVIQFTTSDGTRIPAEGVEQVFNDALVMDAIGDWGRLMPLYSETIDGRQREIYEFALKVYEGVPIPEKLRRP